MTTPTKSRSHRRSRVQGTASTASDHQHGIADRVADLRRKHDRYRVIEVTDLYLYLYLYLYLLYRQQAHRPFTDEVSYTQTIHKIAVPA